jgi:hypothetical protein
MSDKVSSFAAVIAVARVVESAGIEFGTNRLRTWGQELESLRARHITYMRA